MSTSLPSSPPPFPIRSIGSDEFDAWLHAAMAAFHVTPAPDGVEVRRRVTELDRSLAAFDGERIAGTAGACSFRMSVPGGMLPVAGVTEVTVSPAYRRRGVLRSLMDRQLTDLHDHGEPVAALFASETSIYGRFGYARGASDISLRIRRGEGAFVPGAPGGEKLDVRVLDPHQARAELAQVYADSALSRPGNFERDDGWWGKQLLDPEQTRNGYGPLQAVVLEDTELARAYALIAIKNGWDDDGLPDQELAVREFFAADPAAYATLWRHLLDRDLVGTVVAPRRPVDDPLLRLLADPRRARTRLSDNLWARLVRVGDAMAGRTYSRPVDMVIEVIDGFCPANTGRWRLAGDASGATCERTEAAADVSLSVNDLGRAYLGGGSFVDAAAAGLVTEHTPGALQVLSAAMHADPQPWCPLVF